MKPRTEILIGCFVFLVSIIVAITVKLSDHWMALWIPSAVTAGIGLTLIIKPLISK